MKCPLLVKRAMRDLSRTTHAKADIITMLNQCAIVADLLIAERERPKPDPAPAQADYSTRLCYPLVRTLRA